MPGIIGATPGAIVPVSGSVWNPGLVIDGKPQEGYPNVNQVGGEYFDLLGIPLTSGRTFNERDTPASPRVAVVTSTFVERYLEATRLGGSPPLKRAWANWTPMQVVGVVADKVQRRPTEHEPLVYLRTARSHAWCVIDHTCPPGRRRHQHHPRSVALPARSTPACSSR
jgi:hypothetical protein